MRLFSGPESAYIGPKTVLEPLIVQLFVLEDAPQSASPARDGDQRAFIKSFGCQMNVYDAERMADIAAREGIARPRRSRTPISSFSIPATSANGRRRRSIPNSARLRELKDERAGRGRETTLVVAGCLAQAEGAEILRRQPAVDVVVGPQSYHRLPELLREARLRPGVVATDFPAEDKFDHLPAAVARSDARAASRVRHRAGGLRQVLLVLRRALHPRRGGLAPGRARSSTRSRASRRPACARSRCSDRTSTPITGLARDGRAVGLAGLIRAAAAVPGLLRVRYTTSHPSDMSDDLIDAHREFAALAPYLHLPIQSGSDRVLKAMNRRHRVADYLDIVARVRARAAGHRVLLRLHRRLSRRDRSRFRGDAGARSRSRFRLVFRLQIFASPRNPRRRRAGQIDARSRLERLARFRRFSKRSGRRSISASVGRRFEVLFEKPGRREGQVIGRSPYMQAVYADGPRSLIGVMARSRSRRRQAAFAPRPHCLASVVKLGFE